MPADHPKLVALKGDRQNLEFKQVGGTGAGAVVGGNNDNFMVASATGAVDLIVAQNFEVDGEQHTLTLRVTDNNNDGLLVGTITVIVKINDVNDPPVFGTVDTTAWIAEAAQRRSSCEDRGAEQR